MRQRSLRAILLLSLLTLIASLATAADFDPFAGPKPVAVFIETNPWAMALGADTPRVAVYEDGATIFVKKIGDTYTYHRATLDAAALTDFRRHLQPLLAHDALATNYNIAPGVSDQPQALFYLRDGERQVSTTVYGLRAPDTPLPGWTVSATRRKADELPMELLQLHNWLCGFDVAGSKPWTPQYVEVLIWDYSYAPEASIHWPKGWPALNSPRSRKRGDRYSIYLDGTQLPDLEKFLAARNEKGAVEIDGRKWAVSYRHTFPGEPAWRAALAKAARDPE